MFQNEVLTPREQVFITSLLYHGFRKTRRRKDLKYRCGYIIPATRREDSSGIDFWVKMPKDERLLPVQVTQRGIKHYRKYHQYNSTKYKEFVSQSQERVRKKQRWCRAYGIAFVLVRDFDGNSTNTKIAWGDIKALRYAIAHLKRWL